MERQKKIAVILSGCGVNDGSEIHEAVLTLYFIMRNGAKYEIFAPDIPQQHVVNHLTGEIMPEGRNVLIESARIARGKIVPLVDFDAAHFDAVIFPGGFGVAKNLSDYAFKGSDITVNKDVEKVIKDMVSLGKPIGSLCISPVLIAKVLGKVELTVGQDLETIQDLEKMGAEHISTTHGEVIIDERYNIVSSPCYMLDANIVQVGEGAENVVKTILKILGS